MKIISTGSEYRIVDDSLKTYNVLPAKIYTIQFSKQMGFFLEEFNEITINEKIYGVHEKKVIKVLNSFKRAERNLGVILSGDKGIGKSLFAKLLVERAIKNGTPVIIADSYYPGIASFIQSIEQEIVILFDEFDKTYAGKHEDRESLLDPQTEMLTLFDGISTGKKLFIITCNELRNLNDYLVNRPGRFHYHFRFDYPKGDEIREYLIDKGITDENEIKKVIAFASKIKLNFDCLRAITFELSDGSSFEEAIGDLNIINLNREEYIVILYFNGGKRIKTISRMIDLFDGNDEITLDIEVPGFSYWTLGELTFIPTDAEFDISKGLYVIDSKNATWSQRMTIDEDDSDSEKKAFNEWNGAEFQYATIARKYDRSIHYTV